MDFLQSNKEKQRQWVGKKQFLLIESDPSLGDSHDFTSTNTQF